MPTYTVHLTRQHKTKFRTLNKIFEGMEPVQTPISMYKKVTLDYPHKVDSLEEYESFRKAVLANLAPVDENWGSWKLHNALENGDIPAPPPLTVSMDSHAGKAVRNQATKYPTLYGNDPYTPYQVFKHWFCVIGNGMRFDSRGHIVDSTKYPKKDVPVLSMSDEVFVGHIYDHLPLIRDHVPLYPLSEDYAMLFNIPDNIESSFLVAAIDICNYYLSRPTRLCVCYEPNMRGVKVNYAENTWQALVMEDANRYRAKLENAYDAIWERFGTRLHKLGVEKQVYVRDDTPPGQFIQGDSAWKDRKMTVDEEQEKAARIAALLAKYDMPDEEPSPTAGV